MRNRNTKKIVLCGFGIALVFSLSAFVSIPIGQFGYVNLGDSAVMLFASILSPAYAFLVGGIGSALADLYLGYSQYALFTFLIKGLEALLIAFLVRSLHRKMQPLSYFVGMAVMVIGYYLTDAFINQNFIVALTGIGPNFLQGLCSLIIASVFLKLFAGRAEKYFID